MMSVWGLDPATYASHPLHDGERTYTETNCWADVMIELVAAAGHAPEAMLGSCVEVDVDLDQWTFFKPSHEALRRLYGMDVHELQPYRSLPVQIAERIAAGQVVVPELDAYWLPDTAATSYRTEHVKTSVAVEAIDLDAEVLRYFHNAGLHELSGEDFRGIFAPGALLPYTEVVRFAGAPSAEPRETACDLLALHLSRRPADNPFARYAVRLGADLPGLLDAELGDYHAYAFHNPRMAGAAYELLASHVRWLFGAPGEAAALHLDEIVGASKMLLFRLARRRAFDVAGVIGPMAEAWDAAMPMLEELVELGPVPALA
jgi:hypothetical protein